MPGVNVTGHSIGPDPRVVEQLRRGVRLVVRPSTPKLWGIYGDGERPVARFRSQQRAADVLTVSLADHAAALDNCPEPTSSCDGDELPQPKLARRNTLIITPQFQLGEPARYEIWAANRLIPSHDPVSFAPRPEYPTGVQERQYQGDRAEQQKVVRNAQLLRPEVVIATNPTPTDGPPIVTQGGVVLGGNGRTMMLQRMYQLNLEAAPQYREALAQRASIFGYDRADVEALQQPVLVRVVPSLHDDDRPALAKAVRRYNEALTNAIDAKSKAVSQSKQLSESTLRTIGEALLASEGSLRDLLRDDPGVFIRALQTDRVITDRNVSEWIEKSGDLTPNARDSIELAFSGRVLGTPERFARTSPRVLQRLERAVPYLVAVEATNPALGLISEVQAAIDLVNDALQRGMTVAQLVATGGELFGSAAPPTSEARDLAAFFEQAKPNDVRSKFAAWSKVADFDPRQKPLFGAHPSKEAAFAQLGVSMRKNPSTPAVAPAPFVSIDSEDLDKIARELLRVLPDSELSSRGGQLLVELPRSGIVRMTFAADGGLRSVDAGNRSFSKLQRSLAGRLSKALAAKTKHSKDAERAVAAYTKAEEDYFAQVAKTPATGNDPEKAVRLGKKAIDLYAVALNALALSGLSEKDARAKLHLLREDLLQRGLRKAPTPNPGAPAYRQLVPAVLRVARELQKASKAFMQAIKVGDLRRELQSRAGVLASGVPTHSRRDFDAAVRALIEEAREGRTGLHLEGPNDDDLDDNDALFDEDDVGDGTLYWATVQEGRE